MSGRDWYESFFEEGWDQIQADAIPPERTAEHVESIVALLRLEHGERLLDVPCGDGRIAIPLAEHGVRVTGVELNARVLERARATASERRVEADWRQSDMRDLPWQREFDAALCFSGSFGYFDDDGNVDFVRAVHRTLRPGGRFLVDTHVAETLFRIFRESGWERVGQTLVLQERRIDHEAGRIESDWTFVLDGAVFSRSASIRLYTYRELANLLLAGGFTDVVGYDDDGRPFAVPRSDRLRIVATA
jgi:SAM-dependent methyltransferase